MKKPKKESTNEAKLLDHNYDGIQELDNVLPGWWLQTFYWSIVFSIFYFTYYELAGGPDQMAELNQDMIPIELAQQKAGSVGFSESEIRAVMGDSGRIQAGKKSFGEKCAACHGVEGQGLIGPNLADAFWLHGNGKPDSIAKVISDGVSDKGMPGWGTLLPRPELINIAAFVSTMKNTHPGQAKSPQGTEYP